jgi:hypothetical protein
MTCKHLRQIEQAIQARWIRETSRGQAWSRNCREWVYFDCYIDTAAVRRSFKLASCVIEHKHHGTHDGSERGFYCKKCDDGVMGCYEPHAGVVVFRG